MTHLAPKPCIVRPPAAKARAVQILKTVSAVRRFRLRAAGKVVLVPTMGALHAGHGALISRARKLAGEDGTVIVSITVAANGCLLRAEIRRSSGAPELDAAALRRMSQATFLSAEKDKQPLEASVPLIVRFRLTDE